MARYFPYPEIRGGQKQLLKDAEDAVKNGGNLIAHAPTGIGKTAAALAPALEKAVDAGHTVFFLTPKHTQHTIVLETLKKIQRRHEIKPAAIDLVGKRWLCLQELGDLTSQEFNEYCTSQKRDELCRYYNRARKTDVTAAGKKAAQHLRENILHSEQAKEYLKKKQLCPFEILLEAGKKADVIIADYFHLFSTPVRKALLKKMDKDIKESIIIIDEAHNLPDRLRVLLTTRLTDYTIKHASKEAGFLGYHRAAEDIKRIGEEIKKKTRLLKQEPEKYMEKQEFIQLVENAAAAPYHDTCEVLDDIGNTVLKLPKRYRSHTLNLARFLEKWGKAEIGYARINWKKDGKYGLSLNCLDSSLASRDLFSQAHANILMSATLTPTKMYVDQLGLQEDKTHTQAYESPFPPENRLTLLIPDVTTKYKNRSDYTFKKYGHLISKMLAEIPGNTAVFYPSYTIQQKVTKNIKTSKKTLMEKQGMTKHERRKLHKQLANPKNSAVLMGVQAGSLSEGVDYPDSLLDAVFIVGLPLEKPTLMTKALIDYYDLKFERGWDYGYIYPAMNRVLQAAGRCIRSEEDTGAIILMDERFQWNNYRKCLPSDFTYTATQQPEKYLKRFFKKTAGQDDRNIFITQ